MITIKKELFTETQFLTAIEKYQIAKHFDRFVKNGFKREDFNHRVYQHLHLHCGFIAHYSIDGFYETYFNGSIIDLKTFVKHFLNFEAMPYESRLNSAIVDYEPYTDINQVMADILIEYGTYDKILRWENEWRIYN